jgi:serine/threonine protein kinase
VISGIGNKKDYNSFGWQERYRVAVGVAEALDYLHNGCARSVIHRDVKSSNILLSDDFEAQVL